MVAAGEIEGLQVVAAKSEIGRGRRLIGLPQCCGSHTYSHGIAHSFGAGRFTSSPNNIGGRSPKRRRARALVAVSAMIGAVMMSRIVKAEIEPSEGAGAVDTVVTI